jgi:endonuclease YncB( thermonuclease family)
MRHLLALALALLVSPIAALAEPPRVIDGDTFVIDTAVIRLADVDAPELAQKCEGGPAELRPCGAYVADVLAGQLAAGAIDCRVVELDEYDRQIARCEVNGEDLSRWLVTNGLAMAFRRYSDRFAVDEEIAREAGIGLWATDFEPPWEYRAQRWEVAAQEAPEGCPIKGNVNPDGERIYHTPWGSQWYDRTKISADQGERWFCSERQALDAGWRAPLR